MTDACEIHDGQTLVDIATALVDQIRLYQRATNLADGGAPKEIIARACMERETLLSVMKGKIIGFWFISRSAGTDV